jgi:plasmid stability protein
MPTLYVENVPSDRYDALRERAKQNQRSIAAEIMWLLEHFVPTEAELKKRRKAIDGLKRIRSLPPLSTGAFPSAEEMVREDRER